MGDGGRHFQDSGFHGPFGFLGPVVGLVDDGEKRKDGGEERRKAVVDQVCLEEY